jgi:hypothetical protein
VALLFQVITNIEEFNMQIRLRTTGQVMYESEFRTLFPNTSLPQQLTEALINDLGADVVFEGPQAQPTRYQFSFADGVEQLDGKWYTKYSVSDMDQEAKDALDTTQAEAMRKQRNDKLSECDWTQVADAPVDKAVWATYRQALRDVTAQEGFPWTVTYPEKP